MLVKLGNKIPTITVIGIGGFGQQTVQEMALSNKFSDINFPTIAPKKNSLEHNVNITSIDLADKIDNSTTTEDSSQKWREIALDNKEVIKKNLIDTDILFITCNVGKGFSMGITPVVADIARECGALVIAVVTMPFKLEGKKRMLAAEKGLKLIKQSAGTTIVVNKQRIFENIKKGTLVTKAFGQIKIALHQSINIIAEIIQVAEHINIDLADLKSMMDNKSFGFIGEGVGSGTIEERSKQAIEQAFSFPLTNNSITGARNIIFNVTSDKNLGMAETNEIASIITQSANKNANIKFGLTIDEEMKGKIKVTVIATDMDSIDSLKDKTYSNQLTDLNIPTFLRQNGINHKR
ncbi:hypothetical protein HZC27_02615 [Candidatus Roizmanbacteria bacterium]|nr:hypothetical protein [Candidatus Roizmanbacteria bacterium]